MHTSFSALFATGNKGKHKNVKTIPTKPRSECENTMNIILFFQNLRPNLNHQAPATQRNPPKTHIRVLTRSHMDKTKACKPGVASWPSDEASVERSYQSGAWDKPQSSDPRFHKSLKTLRKR